MEEKKKNYTFGEKAEEYSAKRKEQVPVWISPKYLETKRKVIEMLEKFDYLDERDFWILMNETRTGKMGYTGLIISHNGCLKINDNAEPENRFDPSCVLENQNGYNNSLTFTYVNKKQGIYEVGEVSTSNCKNDYPYAMAFKRLFDRVVLKISKLAFYGVYSDSEADEFKEKNEETPTISKRQILEIKKLMEKCKMTKEELQEELGEEDLNKLSYEKADLTITMLTARSKGVE